ncbi:MAG: restriction endonuclease subunit S [Acidimicrobiia bacterium]|nr:restriction endonuclease subunit S [Acidimicrobiia bacterium]MCY4433840.1 restriction endonuclease subunit S [bacterium]
MSIIAELSNPQEWEQVPFGRLVVRTKVSGYPELDPLSVFLDEGVVPRSSRDDNHNRLGEDLSKYLLVEPNDIVFNKLRTWQGGLGVSIYRGIVSPAYFVCRPIQAVDSRFLHYLLRSSVYLQELTRISKWMPPSQFDISWEQLRCLPIVLPSVDEQLQIVDYLEAETARINTLIYKKRRLIELLSEHLRRFTIFHVAGEGYKDLWSPGPYWLGPVPRSWMPHKIAWYKQTGSGTTPESGNSKYYDDLEGIPWVTTSELRETSIRETGQRVTDEACSKYSALKVFPPGSILIAMYGATVGRLGVLEVPAVTNQACCAIFGAGPLDQRFLFWWLWAHREQIISMAYGAGQPNISQEVIRGLRIPAPEVKEQQEIVDRIEREADRVERSIAKLTEFVELLVERRQALITAVVTGEMSVPKV